MARNPAIASNADDDCARLWLFGPRAFEPKRAFIDGISAERMALQRTGLPSNAIPFKLNTRRSASVCRAAVAAVKPGASCGEVDEAARSVLRKAGLAEYFTHSTGHGVGLEIHEGPRIAAEQSQSLLPGMVVTIEPGVYIAGHFGVRIEDMVAVTQEGGQVLTPASTGWTQL